MVSLLVEEQLSKQIVTVNSHLIVFYLVNSSKSSGAEDLDSFEFCFFQDAKLGLIGCRSTGC